MKKITKQQIRDSMNYLSSNLSSVYNYIFPPSAKGIKSKKKTKRIKKQFSRKLEKVQKQKQKQPLHQPIKKSLTRKKQRHHRKQHNKTHKRRHHRDSSLAILANLRKQLKPTSRRKRV